VTADALPRVEDQYATGLSRANIERALVAAGKDLDHLKPVDLEAFTLWVVLPRAG
jgi:hypothetical protein